MVFHCPVCKGAVAYWATAPRFTCHHCGWQLSSNRNRAVLEGVAAGLAIEALVGALLWAWAGSLNSAVGLLLGFGGYAAYAAGWSVIRHRTVFTPQHPPVTTTSAPSAVDRA